jgi:hypothetical protein
MFSFSFANVVFHVQVTGEMNNFSVCICVLDFGMSDVLSIGL